MSDINKTDEGVTLSKYMRFEYFTDLVEHKRLALVDPELWPDKNDSLAIRYYKEKSGIKYLKAACFTRASETSHHWTSYGENGGVRVVFDKFELLKSIRTLAGYDSDEIEYVLLKEFKEKVTELKQIPFVKRKAYINEKEYRIIWTGNHLEGDIKYLKLSDNIIQKIIFGPSVPDDIFYKMRHKIPSLIGNNVAISRSTILYSTGWLKRISSICT